MIKLDQTDLRVAHVDEEDPKYFIAFLLEKDKAAKFDPSGFMDALGAVDETGKTDEEVDVEISELMENWGVLEMFEKEDIDALAEDGTIDRDNLHESLYEVFITDQMDEA